MLGMNELKKAWGIMLHPGSVSKTMDLGDVLGFYYKAAILPTIASVIVAALFGIAAGGLAYSLVGRLLPAMAAGAALFTALLAVGVALLYMLVLIPVGIIINAAIYQLFAKRLFDIWRKPYKNTLTAVLYGEMPVMMFLWLMFIPIVGSFISIVFGIWGLVVLIISMARQQDISGARAFGGILLSAVIIGIIAFVVIFAVAALAFVSLGGVGGHALLGSTCVATSGYTCSAPSYSNGNLAVTLGQSTGSNWASATFAFVPYGYSVNASTFYVLPGGMQSGAIDTVSLPIPSSAVPSRGDISGTIYARYALTTAQAVPTITQVATVTVYKT